MRLKSNIVVICAVAAMALGCSTGPCEETRDCAFETALEDGAPTTGAGSDIGSSSDPSNDSDGGGVLLDLGSGAVPPGCTSEAARYLYLLGIDGHLHRYDPEGDVTEDLGKLPCAAPDDVATGLTIDRAGILWSILVDNEGLRRIITIDPDTLDCEHTSYSDPEGYFSFGGLAFVADAPGSAQESLYLGLQSGFDSANPLKLAKIDTDTMQVTLEGDLPFVENDYYQMADFVGTGESRLFAFYVGEAVVAEIDVAAVSLVFEDSLRFTAGTAWAVTQWSGRLWLFSPNDAGSSQVRTYDLATQHVETISPNIGVLVSGAAVSTCAPFEPEG